MQDDETRQIQAGTTAAIMNLIVMIVDDLDRNNLLDKDGLSARVDDLASNYEATISSEHQLRDQIAVSQLRGFLKLLQHREKPAWKPSVIPGGSTEGKD